METPLERTTNIINILVLGMPGQGKSSTINSCFKITSRKSMKVFPCSCAAIMRGTSRYRSVELDGKGIRLFDIPGVNLEEKVVAKMLEGVQEDVDEFDERKQILDKPVDVENKIDYVIFVVSAIAMESTDYFGFIPYRTVKLTCELLPPAIVDLVSKKTGYDPFVLVTHLNKKHFEEHQYLDPIKKIVPDSEIQLVENYMIPNQANVPRTDAIFNTLLETIQHRVTDLREKKAHRKAQKSGGKQQLKPEDTVLNKT